jgi:hypothetical protein
MLQYSRHAWSLVARWGGRQVGDPAARALHPAAMWYAVVTGLV